MTLDPEDEDRRCTLLEHEEQGGILTPLMRFELAQLELSRQPADSDRHPTTISTRRETP
jgi:hypothetical protein